MFRKRFYYLIKFQYLGHNYHGWQKQPDVKTLEHTISRTLNYVLPDQKFKILGAGRTDAKVSALEAYFELFLDDKPIEDHKEFIVKFNHNLPADIRVLELKQVDETFNVINDVAFKEYHYVFAYGNKSHPFAAPYMCNIKEDLDIELIKEAVPLFEGEHDFSAFIYKGNKNSKKVRTIKHCTIEENTLYQANFFPSTSYLVKVVGHGFGRNQIRLIMGCLFNIGLGKMTITELQNLLNKGSESHLEFIAPATGLILNKVHYKQT